MAVRAPKKPQPAVRDKTCTVCGEAYTYPEPGSRATRFHCQTCADLPAQTRKVLGRMARRIEALEKQLSRVESRTRNPESS